MEVSEADYLKHYGILRESGRYPWGSGKREVGPFPWSSGSTQEERNQTFLSIVDDLRKKEGLSNVEIAKIYGITTTELINARSVAKNAQKQAQINMATRLQDKGYSNVAIGQRMGINESQVRALTKPGELDKLQVLDATTSILKKAVADNKYIDVGTGIEQHLAVSSTKLDKAVFQLKEEGYTLHHVKVEQLGTGHLTTMKVLAGPDVPSSEVWANRDQIKLPFSYSEDGGRHYDIIQKPLPISASRVGVRYSDEGGKNADGVIYVRPGVKDVSLGEARYAQVRVSVDGTHYLKGMAMYKDDLPEGIDLQFNTNKDNTGNKLDAMKPVKSDPVNPFGSLVRQIGEPREDGSKQLTSVMNIVNDEGDWDDWSKSLSSQFLSKQSTKLASTQLGKAFDRQKDEFDELSDLDNPAVKKHLLNKFADGADSAAVHLKAAALPRTQNRVILPIDSMSPKEVYAPQFRDGEQVVLIRHPHGGKFEIPQLTVNNRNPEARKLLGDAEDAIGIHSSVAEKLSGADFDGDTVLVIPNNKKEISTQGTLDGLKGFDPQHEYPQYDGMALMTEEQKGFEMGKISNLITDMSIRGAPDSEIVRAIRHSMVVIDAEKHKLNYKQSAIDNGILALKRRYQTDGISTGASTIVSRASARTDILERKQGFKIDPETGKKIFTETGNQYRETKTEIDPETGEKIYTETGKIIDKTQQSKKLAEVDDAHILSSGTPIENIYADHSNKLKALANEARLASYHTKTTPYSPDAAKSYSDQVKSLDAKLNLALRNSPLERRALIVANGIVAQKKTANPDMDKSEIKKLKFSELENARIRVGAKKVRVQIEPSEWEAIQAGAITNNKLKQILDNTDLDQVKQLATPKVKKMLSDNNLSRAVQMLRNGRTQAEVADALGVSVSTLKRSLSGEGDDD